MPRRWSISSEPMIGARRMFKSCTTQPVISQSAPKTGAECWLRFAGSAAKFPWDEPCGGPGEARINAPISQPVVEEARTVERDRHAPRESTFFQAQYWPVCISSRPGREAHRATRLKCSTRNDSPRAPHGDGQRDELRTCRAAIDRSRTMGAGRPGSRRSA